MLLTVSAFAGIREVSVGNYNGTGSTGADITIDNGNGAVMAKSTYITVATNATMYTYLSSIKTKVKTTTATNSIEIYTDSSNVLNGVTITISDSLLVHNATSGWQLEGISAIGAWDSTNHATTYTLDGNTAATAKDPVFFIDSGDVLSFSALAAGGQTDLPGLFVGKQDMPVHVTITGSGTTVIGGIYSILQ